MTEDKPHTYREQDYLQPVNTHGEKVLMNLYTCGVDQGCHKIHHTCVGIFVQSLSWRERERERNGSPNPSLVWRRNCRESGRATRKKPHGRWVGWTPHPQKLPERPFCPIGEPSPPASQYSHSFEFWMPRYQRPPTGVLRTANRVSQPVWHPFWTYAEGSRQSDGGIWIWPLIWQRPWLRPYGPVTLLRLILSLGQQSPRLVASTLNVTKTTTTMISRVREWPLCLHGFHLSFEIHEWRRMTTGLGDCCPRLRINLSWVTGLQGLSHGSYMNMSWEGPSSQPMVHDSLRIHD